MKYVALVIAFIALIGCVFAADETVSNSVGKVRALGSSGWIEFCPASTSDKTGGSNTDCLRVRPQTFTEVDSNGDVVTNGGKKSINNLGNSMTVGTPSVKSMSTDCTTKAACGWKKDKKDVGLLYQEIPITIDLGSKSAFTAGDTLKITLFLFSANGTVQFDGKKVNVTEGEGKFDINFSSYTFSAKGAAVSFDLTTKSKGDKAIKVEKKAAMSTAGGLINFPRFYSQQDSNSDVAWHDAEITASGDVITYKFTGPFINANYDPITGDESSISSSSSAVSAVVATVAVLTMLVC